MEKLYTYIEIIRINDAKAVKRLDVTGKTERSVNTINSGMNRNLNHNEYYTLIFDSERQLETL